jgi:hypothetical protein
MVGGEEREIKVFHRPTVEEVINSLSPEEQYALGFTDKAPAGHKSIPPGAQIREARGELHIGPAYKPKESAEDWFKETFPSIAKDMGGARPSPGGWRGIYTGSGRYAPRIKTLTF